MSIKNAYEYAKGGDGHFRHYWHEKTDAAWNTLRIDDEMDSATFVIDSSTTGTWAPTIKVETAVRITYSDLEKLIEVGQQILKEAKEDGRR